MPAVVVAAFILALAASKFELSLTKNIRLIGRFVESSNGLAMVFSVFNSIILGLLFGAGGLVVLMASMLGTMITQPVHQFRRARNRAGTRFNELVDDTKETYRPVGKLVKFLVIIATSPLWIPVWLHRRNKEPIRATTAA